MARKNEWITDDELLTSLARVAPEDRRLVLDFAVLMAEDKRAAKALLERARARIAKIDTPEGMEPR
jgi:hypothetical protein